MIETQSGKNNRAFVLHPDLRTETARTPESALEEAVSLAAALPGMDVVGQSVVRVPSVTPATLFGSGKLDELADVFHDLEVELVLVDGPVTPVQQRNLEKHWKVKLLDRTGLILEIFSDRARTREGVLQVEMAALTYQRTRLVRAWTHLERQRGGLGFVGGPGETQIEADRRAIDTQLNRLKRQLTKVVKTRELHRSARAKVPYPIVALVGYTNAGKSTLFNRLTGAGVLAQDMLFATLDPTMRAVTLDDGTDVILSDTVGFISELPTQLVAAFRATLEEVLAADVILHVRDIAHAETEAQAQDVSDIMNTLGVEEDVALFEVWNKLDLLDDTAAETVRNQAERSDNVHLISAVSGAGIDELVTALSAKLQPPRNRARVMLGYGEGKARSWLFENTQVVEESHGDEGYEITVDWTDRERKQFKDLASGSIA